LFLWRWWFPMAHRGQMRHSGSSRRSHRRCPGRTAHRYSSQRGAQSREPATANWKTGETVGWQRHLHSPLRMD
jgi:hypothetical protein